MIIEAVDIELITPKLRNIKLNLTKITPFPLNSFFLLLINIKLKKELITIINNIGVLKIIRKKLLNIPF